VIKWQHKKEAGEMSRENEELVREIRNGVNVDANKVQLFRQNKGLIHKHMKNFTHLDDNLDDWEAEAYFAIEKAVNEYDEEKGRFTTCLRWQLMATYRDYKFRTSGVPAYVLENIAKCNKAEAAIVAEKGKATLEELAERTDLPVDKVEDTKKALLFLSTASINAPVGENQEGYYTLEDTIPDGVDYFDDALEKIYHADSSKEIKEILKNILTTRELELVRLVYYENNSFSEVGRKWGVSQTRVSQINKRIIEKLKYNSYLYSLYVN
jgi:RNA polymerase sigma factor (sigma-70 family)